MDLEPNPATAKITAMIREFGWMVQGVFPNDLSTEASFAYTIGLTSAGLPELVISGNLGARNAQLLLNNAAHLHLDQEIQHGDTVVGVATMAFRALRCGPQAPIQQALNYYCDPHNVKGTVRAMQLIWPCQHGHFPGEPAYCRPAAQQPLYQDTEAQPATG